MKKVELRKKYLQKRETLSQDEVLSFSQKIFENFILQFKPLENQKVHCFLSVSEMGEVDTNLFINYFFEHHIRVFVPKIYQKKLISVEITKDSPLIKSSWGIEEPKSNEDSGEENYDFVVTPLLYCDNQGNRVGYGKGYYDRYFTNGRVQKWGVCFDFQLMNKIPAEPFDIKMDKVITSSVVVE